MKIGISMRIVRDEKSGETRDALAADWAALLEPCSLVPVPVPNALRDPVAFARDCAVGGLILSGGGNVSGFGGEDDSREVLRDRTERRLLDWALEHRLPVLGVCRGMHALNVYFGGSLVSDLSLRPDFAFSHVGAPHAVAFERGMIDSLPESGRVNSWHNSAVDKGTLAPLLRAFARADDGVVEGVIHPELPVVGLEWHPERADSCRAADTAVFRKLFNVELETAR